MSPGRSWLTIGNWLPGPLRTLSNAPYGSGAGEAQGACGSMVRAFAVVVASSSAHDVSGRPLG
jgi:hypothetical protein